MFKADIPFARDDANRFLPWMVALMCALAALMLCAGLTLGRWAATEAGSFGDSFTVQLPSREDKQEETVRKAVTLLEKTPGVGAVRVLSRGDVQKLVEPWLGDGKLFDTLPLPTVLEVTITGKTAPDAKALTRQLDAIAPGAAVDTREAWAEKFLNLSRAIQGAVVLLALCIFAALSGMMVFTARAAMKLHAGTVRLLHAIGAEDGYIARQFQHNALALALRGAVPGTLGAGILYGLLGLYAARLDAPIFPTLTLSGAHLLLLLALPVVCALITVISVRVATLSLLRRLP